MNKVTLMVIIYNAIVIGSIGLYLEYREKKSGRVMDMATGGKNANLALFSVTLALTYLGSAHVYGLMEMSFAVGAVALWFSFAHTILICVICLGTGRWVRRMGCATIPELIGTMHGKQLRALTACVGAMVVFGLVTLETQALGIGISAMSGWSLGWSAVLGAVIGTAYVTMGGIKQTMWVNLINAIVMYVAILIAGIYLAFVLPGGWEGVRDFYVEGDQAFKLSIFGTPKLLTGFALAAIFSVVFSQSVNQQGMAAAMSAENEKTIKRALWISAPINGLFGVFPVLCGLAAFTIPEFRELGAKLAGATMVVKILPTWLAVMVQAGFLGALLSTFAMSALAPATIFAKDIAGANKKGGLTPAEEKHLIQIVIVIIGFIAAVLTFFNQPNVIIGITWLFAWLVPLFFIITTGLFWKRNSNVALIIVVSAWVVNCLWSITPIKNAVVGAVPMFGVFENAHIVAIVSLIATLVFYGFTKTSEPAIFAKKA